MSACPITSHINIKQFFTSYLTRRSPAHYSWWSRSQSALAAEGRTMHLLPEARRRRRDEHTLCPSTSLEINQFNYKRNKACNKPIIFFTFIHFYNHSWNTNLRALVLRLHKSAPAKNHCPSDRLHHLRPLRLKIQRRDGAGTPP